MKTEPFSFDASRRCFLRRAALGGLTVLSASLIMRRNARACVNDGLCHGCPEFEDCTLPPAVEKKHSAAPQTPLQS